MTLYIANNSSNRILFRMIFIQFQVKVGAFLGTCWYSLTQKQA